MLSFCANLGKSMRLLDWQNAVEVLNLLQKLRVRSYVTQKGTATVISSRDDFVNVLNDQSDSLNWKMTADWQFLSFLAKFCSEEVCWCFGLVFLPSIVRSLI